MPAENVIPTAVQAQVDAAEKAMTDAAEAAKPKVEPTPAPEPAEPTAPVEPEAPVETAVEPTPAPGEPEAPAEPQPTPQPPAEAAPEAPVDTSAEVQAELTRLREAHSVLTGKYSKEVPRYAREVREKNERIQELEDRLAARAAPAPAPTPPVDPSNPYGLNQDERDLGDEVVTLDEKVADVRTDAKLAPYEARLQAVEQRLAGFETDDSETFYGTLASMVPDYDEIDTDRGFNRWLDEPDPLQGTTRRELLHEAQKNDDGVRAASMFLAWKKKASEPVAPVASQTQRPSVAAQVPPRTVARDAAPPPKKIWTIPQYEALMKEIALAGPGQPHSREWATKKSAELDLAASEGRVR